MVTRIIPRAGANVGFARNALTSYTAAMAFCALGTRGDAQPTFPTISARQFASGSAKLKVTGSFSIDADIAINDKASFGAGEMTWVQFGGQDQVLLRALWPACRG